MDTSTVKDQIQPLQGSAPGITNQLSQFAKPVSGATGASTTVSGAIKASIVPGAATMGDRAFSPNPINIKIGNSVTWTNNDNIFHTVTSGTWPDDANKGKAFDSGLSGPSALTTTGKTFSHTFATPGKFPYFCQLHPTMVGMVVVS